MKRALFGKKGLLLIPIFCQLWPLDVPNKMLSMDSVVGVPCILEQTCQYHLDIEGPLGTSRGPYHQPIDKENLSQKYFFVRTLLSTAGLSKSYTRK